MSLTVIQVFEQIKDFGSSSPKSPNVLKLFSKIKALLELNYITYSVIGLQIMNPGDFH